MSADAEKVIDAALRLSAKERELIVGRLQDSLQGEDTRTDIRVNWMRESVLHVERLRRGEMQLLEMDDTPELQPRRR
jgi:hypothetical protein